MKTIANAIKSDQNSAHWSSKQPPGWRTGDGLDYLEPLAEAGLSGISSWTPGTSSREAPTSVTLNNQGLIDLLQAAVTGLKPKTTYILALVPSEQNERRYLVIFPAEVGGKPKPVQIQLE